MSLEPLGVDTPNDAGEEAGPVGFGNRGHLGHEGLHAAQLPGLTLAGCAACQMTLGPASVAIRKGAIEVGAETSANPEAGQHDGRTLRHPAAILIGT